ncbi:response regulator [Marinilabiliaceae bacterium JC017]|nr:response regulator [Marinilabiliaceae bacterium JC017]
MWKSTNFNVLIIQDCLNTLNSLRNTLNSDDFKILASNGDHALETSIKEEPDVILMDLLLKNRKGFDILQSLKNHWNTEDIPIIITTKINTQEHWDESYRLGASGYVVLGKHNHYLPEKIRKVAKYRKALAS